MGFDLGDVRYPQSKPAPVLFCVDVTGSMTYKVENGLEKDRMDLANDLVETFIRYILSIDKAARAVEVAFVLFAHEIVLETDFVRLKQLSESAFRNARVRDCWDGQKPWTLTSVKARIGNTDYHNGSVSPRFSCCRDRGTKIDSAILHCYEKILSYMEQNIHVDKKGQKKAAFYAPHFVLITDGDPTDSNKRQRDDDQTHEEAKNMIYDHCYTGRDGTNLIVPITVGVFGKEIGQEAIQRVYDYGENFMAGYFPVRDEKATQDFRKAAEFLCKTVVKSLNLACTRIDDDQNSDPKKGKSVEEVFGE